MDEGPDPECHGGGGEVCLFARGVHVVGTGYGVHIGAEGEKEDDNVGDLGVSMSKGGVRWEGER